MMNALFKTHLFPNIDSSQAGLKVKPHVPVLHSETRGRLYSILLAISNDLAAFEKLLNLVKDLLPQGEDSGAWSWGCAQLVEEFPYEANWNFDRLKAIRSSTGYSGMKNLSNTCYLNSLFTQLFMNVPFRQFMLNADVTEPETTQSLLWETKKLFAYMQETWLKAVDPQGVASSIVTYEGDAIDVAIQMDVDEFYNLLFDRLESQILSAAEKKSFRQFYGGQIVQQIKSKECAHISERLEPFSAIQCEIVGKASLVESLKAYVEGEVMEGGS
jgi:ubiquitin carboxyl-terminal hydrolase 34